MKLHPVARRSAAAGLLLISAAGLVGCLGPVIVGGAAAGIMVAVDRRQPEVILGDERIDFSGSSRVGDVLKDQGHVNVTSYNNMVLLSGEVPTAELKAQVEKIVSEVPKVKSVVNELQISGASSYASRSNDALITGKVKGNFITANKFQANHVKVVTEAGVVYLMGLVTREEADAASEIARGTGSVQKVVRVFEYVVLNTK
jgi:osmotically-inducible protein OsmY